jgi:hypothetical protein
MGRYMEATFISPPYTYMTTKYSVTFELSSGFTIQVEPFPPYYVDFLDDLMPFKKYPKRKLTLAGGDVVEFEYTPPETPPDASDVEEYELYLLWHSVDEENKQITIMRDRAKRDYLLSHCVEIISGPVDINDNVWVERLEAAIPDIEISDHPGARRLAFIKSVVVRTLAEYDKILAASLFPEVTMQGIMTALQGFRGDVGRNSNSRRHRRKSKSQ